MSLPDKGFVIKVGTVLRTSIPLLENVLVRAMYELVSTRKQRSAPQFDRASQLVLVVSGALLPPVVPEVAAYYPRVNLDPHGLVHMQDCQVRFRLLVFRPASPEHPCFVILLKHVQEVLNVQHACDIAGCEVQTGVPTQVVFERRQTQVTFPCHVVCKPSEIFYVNLFRSSRS